MRNPPKVAIDQLAEWGHVVDNWMRRTQWWVGYSRDAICTVSCVTGKILIEVCKRDKYTELPRRVVKNRTDVETSDTRPCFNDGGYEKGMGLKDY